MCIRRQDGAGCAGRIEKLSALRVETGFDGKADLHKVPGYSNAFASSDSARVTLPAGFAQHSNRVPSDGGSSGSSVYSIFPSTRLVTHVLQTPIRQLNAG